MSRPSAIDAPVVLAELVDATELAELARSFADLHHVGIAILDSLGQVITFAGHHDPEGGSPGQSYHREPLVHHGETLGAIAIGPHRLSDSAARALARHIANLLGMLVHAAHARHLTAALHVAAMDESYHELADKNRRLSEAVERLQELDRLKSNFLATVSHELRTPLTSIIGYSEMLLEGLAGQLNKDQREYVQTVLGKADQLLQLITGILDVSLSESGALRLAREPVDLDEIIQATLASFGAQARRRRIELGSRPRKVPRVLGDSRKIRQIVGNLLANAIKFTAEGGWISVALEVGPMAREDDSGHKLGHGDHPSPLGVRVSVHDSGIGIAPEKQSHIFEPFFQVDSSSTREYGGTGLGLTLVKSYVEAHGGHVWVDSAVGRGSVFTFSLPAVPEELEAFLGAPFRA